jgi:hypothetical protein
MSIGRKPPATHIAVRQEHDHEKLIEVQLQRAKETKLAYCLYSCLASNAGKHASAGWDWTSWRWTINPRAIARRLRRTRLQIVWKYNKMRASERNHRIRVGPVLSDELAVAVERSVESLPPCPMPSATRQSHSGTSYQERLTALRPCFTTGLPLSCAIV